MRFLVVDDSRIARKRVKDFIENLGYEVVAEASNGLEAIEVFKQHNIDIVTIDLEMPKLSGIEASKELLLLNPDINIILVTSIVDKKEIITALQIGIKDVLKKPFNLESFTNVIEKLK